MPCDNLAGGDGREGGVQPMNGCGRYRVLKGGKPVATVVAHDDFASAFASMERVGDAPCNGDTPKSGLLSKAASWLKAEASLLIQGELPADAQASRRAACESCPRLIRSEDDELGYCGACGCGHNRRARLAASKIRMPAAKCPLGKWGDQ